MLLYVVVCLDGSAFCSRSAAFFIHSQPEVSAEGIFAHVTGTLPRLNFTVKYFFWLCSSFVSTSEEQGRGKRTSLLHTEWYRNSSSVIS